MRKDEKEKLISNVRMREIESMDRDITSFVFKLFFAWAAVFAYFFKIGFTDFTAFLLAAFLFVIMLYQYNTYNYITDCYDWLCVTIKEDKFFEETTPLMEISDGFWYKKKYSNSFGKS